MDYVLVDPSEERRILDFRPLGFHDVVVLGRYSYATAHETLDDHCHGKMVEICYLDRGEQTYFVGAERFDLIGGDVFVTFPHERHGSGPLRQGKGVLYWMLIHLPGRNQQFLSLSPAMARRLLDALLHLPSRHFRGGEVLGKTLRRIFEVYDRLPTPIRIIELQNLMLRFLLDLLEASGNSQTKITAAIGEVQGFIAQNIDCPLTVRQLARLAGLSESRFKARFKKEVGIPPADYMMRKKIDRAMLLFQAGNATVTEVAMRLGFSTAQYFSTVFKRYTGQTPGQYRGQLPQPSDAPMGCSTREV